MNDSQHPANHISGDSKPDNDSSAHWAARLMRDRRMLVLIVGLVVVAGLSSVVILPRMEDPVLIQRVAIVNTPLPGADASRVEALVTEKLEDELREVDTIKELRSQSRSGLSSITIELLDTVMESDLVWSEIRSRLEDAIPKLPEQAGRPEFENIEVRAYTRIVSVVWDRDEAVDYSVLRRTAKDLQDRLQAIAGTEKVDRLGDPGEEVLVQVDAARAASMGLSTADIADQLRLHDAKDAAGQIRGRKQDLAVELENQFHDLGDVENAQIQSSQGSFVSLGSLATVTTATPQPMARLALHGEKTAITLGALVRPEFRIDLWSQQATACIDDFAAELPHGLRLVEIMDQNTYVAARLSSLLWNLILGGVAVVAVVCLMMGWRSSLVVASALPLTMLTVLFAMRVLGIPIHQMSITGLIIALGLLIDNAIVVADEIRSEMVHGATPTEAMVMTIKKLTIPLLGSSLTTVFAFAPIALMPGPAGEFVGSIAYSVMLAIMASLVFSLTVVASIAAICLKVQKPGAQHAARWSESVTQTWRNGFRSERLQDAYRKSMNRVFSHPKKSLVIVMLVPILGFVGATQLPEQFFPPADRDQFRVDVELATGASLADTQRVAKRVQQLLDEQPEVRQVDWFLGESAPTFYYNSIANRSGQPNFAQAIVQVDQLDQVFDLISKLQAEMDHTIPEARTLVRQLEQGPPFDAPVELRLYGPDMVVLTEIGEQLRSVIAELADVTHTRSLLGESSTKVAIDVDAASASLAGLTPQMVQSQVQASLDGMIAGSVIQDTEQMPVRVRTRDEQRREWSSIEELDLVTATADGTNIVPLRSVAAMRLEPETGVIVHFNRRRMNEVSAFLNVGVLPATVLAALEKRLAAQEFRLPDGYTKEYGGEASKRNDAVGNLSANVGVLAALMVATLVLSFSSFRLAGIIGLVGFLSVGLGMGALYLGGYPFGFMAIIGTMGLVGVAINDSIVVLATLQETYGRRSVTSAELTETVMRCTRHVLATTFTTVAGFLPLIWSGGQFWPPLAVAISGGVLGATLLALVFVPIAYRWAYCSAGVTDHSTQVARDVGTGRVRQLVNVHAQA